MEFLDFARPQELKLRRGDVNEVVKKTLDFIQPKANEQGVKIHNKISTAALPVDHDSELLYRALLNIVVNALQAMPTGGDLHVETRQGAEGGIEIEVRDTGCGMSENKMEYIFNPFYTDKQKGTGLGLSITKNIIVSHQGSLHVSSAEDQGTTFVVALP
jgi:signal transduction histidine kinase